MSNSRDIGQLRPLIEEKRKEKKTKKNNKKPSIVFFGSSIYSTIVEKALLEKKYLKLVVTLPDATDRKTKKTIINPVKQVAMIHNIPFLQTDKLHAATIEKIATYNPDFLVIADYRLIIPQSLLNLPKVAPINVHHSLLPKFRGPAPAPFVLLSNDTESGVSIITMNDKVDAGDILGQKKYTLKKTDTTESLLKQLNTLGAEILIPILQNYPKAYAHRVVQHEDKATYTHYMDRKSGFFDISTPPSFEMLDRMIRAYYPWPGVWTKIMIRGQEKILKLLPNHLLQVEGKSPVNYKDFLNGYTELKDTIEGIFQKRT